MIKNRPKSIEKHQKTIKKRSKSIEKRSQPFDVPAGPMRIFSLFFRQMSRRQQVPLHGTTRKTELKKPFVANAHFKNCSRRKVRSEMHGHAGRGATPPRADYAKKANAWSVSPSMATVRCRPPVTAGTCTTRISLANSASSGTTVDRALGAWSRKEVLKRLPGSSG